MRSLHWQTFQLFSVASRVPIASVRSMEYRITYRQWVRRKMKVDAHHEILWREGESGQARS